MTNIQFLIARLREEVTLVKESETSRLLEEAANAMEQMQKRLQGKEADYYIYRFHSPFGGDHLSLSPDEWNGQNPYLVTPVYETKP